MSVHVMDMEGMRMVREIVFFIIVVGVLAFIAFSPYLVMSWSAWRAKVSFLNTERSHMAWVSRLGVPVLWVGAGFAVFLVVQVMREQPVNGRAAPPSRGSHGLPTFDATSRATPPTVSTPRPAEEIRVAQARVLWAHGWRDETWTRHETFRDYLQRIPPIPNDLLPPNERFPALILVDRRPFWRTTNELGAPHEWTAIAGACDGLDVTCTHPYREYSDFDSKISVREATYWARMQVTRRYVNGPTGIESARKDFSVDEVAATVFEVLALYAQHGSFLRHEQRGTEADSFGIFAIGSLVPTIGSLVGSRDPFVPAFIEHRRWFTSSAELRPISPHSSGYVATRWRPIRKQANVAITSEDPPAAQPLSPTP